MMDSFKNGNFSSGFLAITIVVHDTLARYLNVVRVSGKIDNAECTVSEWEVVDRPETDLKTRFGVRCIEYWSDLIRWLWLEDSHTMNRVVVVVGKHCRFQLIDHFRLCTHPYYDQVTGQYLHPEESYYGGESPGYRFVLAYPVDIGHH